MELRRGRGGLWGVGCRYNLYVCYVRCNQTHLCPHAPYPLYARTLLPPPLPHSPPPPLPSLCPLSLLIDEEKECGAECVGQEVCGADSVGQGVCGAESVGQGVCGVWSVEQGV